MKSFEYFNPVRIHYETPYLKALEYILDQYSDILLVTTQGVLKRFPDVAQKACQHNVEIVSNIQPNPELEFLQKIKHSLSKKQCIVAIGGGSVMDSAKFLSVYGEIAPNNGSLDISKDSEFMSLYAIPTTAGTSSELTKWATIWDSSNLIKYSLSHDKLYPQEAFYDSHLMLTLPREETINGALDTLSHCLESIWNKNSNPISTSNAIRGIEIVLDILPKLLDNLDSLSLRKQITLSNIYAGLAFSNTQTALAHALSYPMTMKLGIPHGIACSITLPILIKSMQEGVEKERILPFTNRVIGLFEKIGVSTKLGDYGITQEFIDEIFSSLNARAKNGLFDIESVKESILKYI